MSLEFKVKHLKTIIWTLFILYTLLLLKILLFKYGAEMTCLLLKETDKSYSYRINTIPFKTIKFYYRSSDIDMFMNQIIGNIIAFTPMGLMLPILFNKLKSIKSIFITCFIISLFFESIQLLTNLGSFDVDDIILNTLGAVIGYILYKVFLQFIIKNFKSKRTT